MLHNGRPGAIRSAGLRRGSARNRGMLARPVRHTGGRNRRSRGCLSGERMRRRVFGLRRLAAIARRRCVVRIHRLSPISTPP